MWVFTLILILLFSYFFIKKYELDYFEAIPLGLCSILLIMYGLCFFRGLWLLDWIGLAVSIFLLIRLFLRKESLLLKDFLKETIWNWKSFSLILFIVTAVCITFYKTVNWWDDINFWATDAKFYYFYGGFADKYGNVAPEFGDYPPLLSMMKWLFLHTNTATFQEGLIFAAYFTLLAILLLPLLRYMKKERPVFWLLAIPVLFLSYSMFDGTYMEGCCADLVMGALYGNLLWAIFRERFTVLPVAIYGAALVLTKSVGIEWYIFAAILCIALKILRRNKESILGRTGWWKLLFALAFPIIVELSWMAFCFINRRVAKLTGASVKIAVNGNFSFLENATEKAVIFLKGFFFYPMNGNEGFGFTLSSGIYFLLLIILLIFLVKKNIISSKERFSEGNLMILYTVLTAVAAYGIIFLGHITIFAGELQYQDPKIMAISIARYGSPFTIGMFILIAHICLNFYTENDSRCKWKGNTLIYFSMLLVILAFCHYDDIVNDLLKIPDQRNYEEELQNRQDMIEIEGQTYAKECRANPELAGKRVLYLRENESIHWVKDAYINYEVSPIATIYTGVDALKMTREEIYQKIQESHAALLYCDDVQGEVSLLFTDLLKNGKFETEQFYQIVYHGSEIELKKYE